MHAKRAANVSLERECVSNAYVCKYAALCSKNQKESHFPFDKKDDCG